jgi:hypothetical protein
VALSSEGKSFKQVDNVIPWSLEWVGVGQLARHPFIVPIESAFLLSSGVSIPTLLVNNFPYLLFLQTARFFKSFYSAFCT